MVGRLVGWGFRIYVAQNARRIIRDDRICEYVFGDRTAGVDDRALANRDIREDGRSRPNGGSPAHLCGFNLPMRLGLELTVRSGARVCAVDERHAVTDEDFILNRHALAYEPVA